MNSCIALVLAALVPAPVQLGGATISTSQPPGGSQYQALPCPAGIYDQANGGPCILGSSVPMLGQLYPLGPELNVTPGGNVGIGTIFPAWPVHVEAPQGVCRLDSLSSVNGSVLELRSQVSNPNFVGAINFVNDLGQYKGQLAYEGDDELAVRVNGGERLRIQADGTLVAKGRIEQVQPIGGTWAATFHNTHAFTSSDGVNAISSATAGVGVAGRSLSTTGVGIGAYGVTASSSGYGVFSSGSFGGSGAKYFVQPHPADASKEVRFVCLEGNESGTYFRGTSRLVNGRAAIVVPEEFRLVTEPEGLTVQITPTGGPALTWVPEKGLDLILVAGDADVAFDYFVNGVRRGFADHQAVRDNQAFVPTVRDVPFGTQYPDALRQILVDNGTLHPDFTPNEATAIRLGWPLEEPELP